MTCWLLGDRGFVVGRWYARGQRTRGVAARAWRFDGFAGDTVRATRPSGSTVAFARDAWLRLVGHELSGDQAATLQGRCLAAIAARLDGAPSRPPAP